MRGEQLKGPLRTVIEVVALIVIVGGVLGIVGQMVSSSLPSSTHQSSSASADQRSSSVGAAKPSTIPTVNQPADDGKFRFVVTSFSCGQTSLVNDNQFESATAQGQWCLLALEYRNIGSEAQTFETDAQYLYDASGKQYSADPSGTMAANPSGSQCIAFQQVNPGVSSSCVVAFDVPKGAALTSAILHDSSFSGGVKVALK